jgi:hypothetical protein
MTNQDNYKLLKLTIAFTAIPAIALANAGSPMMWFGILHLLILNAIIGDLESVIVAKFKIANRTWLIIIGNYVSMFIGLYFIAPHFSTITGNHDFWGGKTRLGDYHLKGFVAGMIWAFFATLIIELPFFYLAVKEKVQRRQILLPFIVANTTTNLGMLLIYYLITGVENDGRVRSQPITVCL